MLKLLHTLVKITQIDKDVTEVEQNKTVSDNIYKCQITVCVLCVLCVCVCVCVPSGAPSQLPCVMYCYNITYENTWLLL